MSSLNWKGRKEVVWSIPMRRVRTIILELIRVISLSYFFNMDLKPWEFHFHYEKVPPNKCCWPLNTLLLAFSTMEMKGKKKIIPFFFARDLGIHFVLPQSYISLNNHHLFNISIHGDIEEFMFSRPVIILTLLLWALSSWHTLTLL